MLKTILIMITITLAAVWLPRTASAQITINIPNLPSFKKKPKPAATPETVVVSAEAPDGAPPIAATGNAPVAAPAKTCDSDSFYRVWNEDIQKSADDIRSFTPTRGWFVRDFNDDENKYLKMALSDSIRRDRMKSWEEDAVKGCVNARLDELKTLAEAKIQGYSPHDFTLGTPAEKATLRAAFTDINIAKIYQAGIKSPEWKISTNEFGIPTHRRKFGALWVKYPDDKYCRIYWINVFQAYAGGGTYGANQGQYISWEFAGCPAGK